MYKFKFGFRLMCECFDAPEKAGNNLGMAYIVAKEDMLPHSSHIAPRITLRVSFWGFDRLDPSPDRCAYYIAYVESDNLALLRALRQNAADEWNDGEAADYPITQSVAEESA